MSDYRPDHSASFRVPVDASCGHFLFVWVNDRSQEVVNAQLDAVQAEVCPRCTGAWTRPFPPEIYRFTRFHQEV